MGDIHTNAPEWAEFYNPVVGGTYFGVIGGNLSYKHNHAPQIYGCGSATYKMWQKENDTVRIIQIQENE
jgi:hypothetical protein